MNAIDKIKTLVAKKKLSGIGNLMLDVLTRPGQEKTPDADCLALLAMIDELVRAYFKIPEDLTYSIAFHDKYLELEDHGVWEKDGYLLLFIWAYALGATREKLPPPNDWSTAGLYYRTLGCEQKYRVLAAKEKWLVQKQERWQRRFEKDQVEVRPFRKNGDLGSHHLYMRYIKVYRIHSEAWREMFDTAQEHQRLWTQWIKADRARLRALVATAPPASDPLAKVFFSPEPDGEESQPDYGDTFNPSQI